ncbi:MAG: exodeoxyribonuclease V subunit gamma, partial [Bacteroidales bacterium]|nr:exodeoxyribonuclease V subunit gamma [Bacteroidales bacterium]
MSYLDELNEPQRAAVEYIDGPALVIAGAGSGKTRVLTYKIMHLLEGGGYRPYNILAITFTNKAAREMKERIAQKIGEERAKQLYMGTFHSIFMRILRKEISHTGYQNNFTIYDSEDAKKVVKGIIKDLNLDDKLYDVKTVYSRISAAKNDLITPEMYEASPMYADDANQKRYKTAQIYKTYVRKCMTSNAMDFDDLLLQTHLLFKNNPDLIQKYSNLFKYILVDEYQDTNSVQYNIVRALASVHHKLFVVGDDAQSIYAFRGAKIENILNFKKDYPEAQIFKLEQNYRSTKMIVNAANTVIAQNTRQMKKETFSENEDGDKIRVMESAADNEEAFKIAAEIHKQVNTYGAKYSDFALLYRSHSQSRSLEESLHKRQIPYKIFGGLSFYERLEIKDFIAWMKLTQNGNDDEAFKRVVDHSKQGIGTSTMDKLSALSTANQLSIWDTASRIKVLDPSISPRVVTAIGKFMTLIYNLSRECSTLDAYEAAVKIGSTSKILEELSKDKSEETKARYENVMELLNGIKQFVDNRKKDGEPCSLSDYLEEVSLMTGDEQTDEPNQVSLLTIHASKGLEFKNVYLCGVEDGLFPSQKSAESNAQLEEERRLFYVAVTRAQKRLIISYARMRFKYGQLAPAQPSRFIKEIDTKYLDFGAGGESGFEASRDIPFAGRFRKTFAENDSNLRG